MDLRHRDWRNHRKSLLGADRYVKNLETKIDRYFRLLRLPDAEIQVTHLMNKGGLEMTEADRSRVLETAREKLKDPAPIVITHGTETMIDTGLSQE